MMIHLSKILSLAVAMCAVMSACQNDLISSAYKETDENAISFGATTQDQWSDTRLSEEPSGIVSQTILRGENPQDTLCLAMSIIDSFEVPSTRANPVESKDFNNFGVFCFTNDDKPFMVNEKHTKSNTIWTGENIYYWPDAKMSLSFFAYSPHNAAWQIAKTNSKYSFNYTVPAKAADQQDIMVANKMGLSSNGTPSPIPLGFKHICTAVRFVTGTEFQAGTIKKITLKNIQTAGSFDMEALNWLEGGTQDGSHSEDLDITISEADKGGTDILNGEKTLMMIPQTTNNAVIEIVLATSEGNKIITGKLPVEWVMGKKVSYNITITPDYGLQIKGDGKPIDAHYVMSSINIAAVDARKEWTLSSDVDWVTFVSSKTEYAEAGYWIEEEKGKTTINGKGQNTPIYIYIAENAGTANRTATLTLRPKDKPNATPVIYTLEQLHPVWGSSFGIEQIEEIPLLPWGFNWDHTVNYSISNGFIKLILWGCSLFGWIPNGITYNIGGKATVNYSDYKYNIANSETNGYDNTNKLITFSGGGSSNSFILSLIEDYGVPTESGEGISTDHIIKHLIQKNRYHYEKVGTNNVPKLKDEDFVWYLPAVEEYKSMEDILNNNNSYMNLSGDYWTSTTDDTNIDDGLTSFKYTAPGKQSARQDRSTPLKVRAARKALTNP